MLPSSLEHEVVLFKMWLFVMRLPLYGILTEGYHNEGPTWAPDGRTLMFFRETPGANGGPKLHTIDLTGRNEQQVNTQAFASDPAWSPLLD